MSPAMTQGHDQHPTDPAALARSVFTWIGDSEQLVDAECVNLYAGTNIQSPAVRRAMATTMNSRPSLGPPGDKYETGLVYSDRIEVAAMDLLGRAFHARFVEPRTLSGSMANLVAYMATTRPGDDIFAMPLEVGAHATHHAEGAAGLFGLHVHSIPCQPGTHLIDWGAFAVELERVRPRLVVMGTSLPLLPYKLERVAALAHGVGARLMYDGAHVAGLIVGGCFQQPLDEGADLLTTSTYKSFGGPAGGLVATNDEELAARVRQVVYPGLTANFDMGRLAGTAIAAVEQLQFGSTYARQCIANASALATDLALCGLPVWNPDGESGGRATHSHLVAIDARPFGGGTKAARVAERSNVLFSGIPLPVETSVDAQPYGGIRLGVQELTRWGMTEPDMGPVADLVTNALTQPSHADQWRRQVLDLRRRFRTVHFQLDVATSVPDYKPA